jgi:hypothetical protein
VAEIEPGEYVDTYINMRNKERQSEETLDPNIRRWFLKSSPDILGGYTTDHMVNKMTAAGIERGLLNNSRLAGTAGQPTIPTTAQLTLDEWRANCAEIAEVCQAYPGPYLWKLQY